MTDTPDHITTAREAVKSIFNDADYGPNPDDLAKITTALDYAEKLKAERDELEKSVSAHWTEIEHLNAATDSEVTRLTSQLEQAETSALRHLSELVKISERLGGTSTPAPGYAIGLVNQLAEELECPGPKGASQWIKDRQATGEAL